MPQSKMAYSVVDEDSDWKTVSTSSEGSGGKQEEESISEIQPSITSSKEVFLDAQEQLKDDVSVDTTKASKDSEKGSDHGDCDLSKASEIFQHLVKAVSNGEDEELAKGKLFYYLADIVGVATILQFCGVAEELGVMVGDNIPAEKLERSIVIAVESKLRELGEREAIGARGRIQKRREQLGEMEMRKQYATILSPPREEDPSAESDQKGKGKYSTERPTTNDTQPASNMSSGKMKDLGLPLSMTADLASLNLSTVPAKTSPSSNIPPTLNAAVEAPKKKSKAKWSRLHAARARCEEDLRSALPFDKDPKFLDNIGHYKMHCLDIKNSAPEIYDVMRVACCAGSINKVTNKMIKEKEAGMYVEPGPGRIALDDPICRRWRTLKRDFPEVEVIIENLYKEHMEKKDGDEAKKEEEN